MILSILSILTTSIEVIMGRRLLDEVVHRIRIRIEAGEAVPAIAEAVKVGKKTIYKIRLNLDIWGEPYAPPTVVLGRPRALLHPKRVINILVITVEDF